MVICSSGPTAVSVQRRRSARLLTPDVRTHYSIAPGTTLVTRPGAHPVWFVCSGISLCARHSTSVPGRQPAAAIRASEVVARRHLRSVASPTLLATAHFLLQRGHRTVTQSNNPLQHIHNSIARAVLKTPYKSCHITPILHSLY